MDKKQNKDKKEDDLAAKDGEAEEVETLDPSAGMTPLEDMIRRAETIEFMHSMLKRLKVDHGLRSVKMANAPNEYYQWDLSKRMNFLGAPSTQSLCKTMIMENYQYR